MTYSQAATHDRVAEINIIPLADIMLVLLIVFMISSPALSQRIDVDLPQHTPPVDATPPPPIELHIDAAGDVHWNGDLVAPRALQALLAAEVERDPARVPALAIDANGDADYQAVARVVAAARNAGVAAVGFVRRD